jgi:fibro-slime domain-containing protein
MCGDGLVVPGEECDDGNNVDGDGCSKDCKIERGWSCPQPTLVNKLMLPVIYRDFRYHTPPEFEAAVPIEITAVLGMVNEDLDVDGKPVYSGLGENSHITTAGAFAEWYGDLPGINHSTASKLALWDNGHGGNVNRYGANGEQWQETLTANWCGTVGYETKDPNGNPQPCTFAYGQTVCDTDAALGYTPLACASDGKSYSATFAIKLDGNPFFFPVDDDLFTPMSERSIATIPVYYDPAMTKPHDVDADGNERMHNFSFTSEVRYWFRHDKNLFSRLDVAGEDDVWVFINKKLALDLGGVHVPLEGSVTLDADTASRLGLADGNVYEVAIFQAQRQTSESSYKLTLTGFNAAPSQCASRCGDDIVSLGEECDDGVNAGGYGQCGRGCKLGAYCGDGIVQPEEDCDDGVNNGHPCPSGCRNLIDN